MAIMPLRTTTTDTDLAHLAGGVVDAASAMAVGIVGAAAGLAGGILGSPYGFYPGYVYYPAW